MKKNKQEWISQYEDIQNDDLRKAVYEMTDESMDRLLLELSTTAYWVAILKYLLTRRKIADTATRSVDPFKDPTLVARSQGIGSGLMDLPDAVNFLIEKVAKRAEEQDESK